MRNPIARLLVLFSALALTWGAAALIPAEPALRPAAIVLALPSEIDGRTGHPQPPSEQEIALLAEDTTFEKRLYCDSGSDSVDSQMTGISCGIVLSGHDLNNSIHRPERCLLAQGFQDLAITPVTIELADGRSLAVRRIDSYRTFTNHDGGDSYRVANILYYWFVGSDMTTPSHYERALTDIKDRLLGGFNQRWAYFSVSANVLDGLPGIATRDADQTDALLRRYIGRVTEACIKDSVF